METPAPPSRSLRDLRELTPARVALGRAGASLPTKALLEFTLDHARARDAVHAGFDVAAVLAGLGDLGLEALDVCSRARSRKDYLRRPDLGRTLDPASRHLLASRHPLSSLGWGVLVEIPMEEIDKAIWKAERPLGLIGLLFLALALAIGSAGVLLYSRLRESREHVRTQNTLH